MWGVRRQEEGPARAEPSRIKSRGVIHSALSSEFVLLTHWAALYIHFHTNKPSTSEPAAPKGFQTRPALPPGCPCRNRPAATAILCSLAPRESSTLCTFASSPFYISKSPNPGPGSRASRWAAKKSPAGADGLQRGHVRSFRRFAPTWGTHEFRPLKSATQLVMLRMLWAGGAYLAPSPCHG